MTQIQRLLIALFGLVFVSSVSAEPAQLTEVQFTAQTAGLSTIIETFDDFPTGSPGSPFTIANGTYTGSPQISFGAWCILSQCMNTNFVDGNFDGFPKGTTFWSTKIIYASSGDIVQVTVTGNSGVLQFNLPEGIWVSGGVFVGFSDPTGLTSITFSRLVEEGSNYAFDDVTTAAAPPVVNMGRLSIPLIRAAMDKRAEGK